eukprot:TRINITY_DN54747_c0_g2_i1.p1 TRINITY_DN54747_c0_g2~~TRINITY_DN54747_c0_g2_i1.p1  ORF type:complete len:562 (-),score=72.17 TRINITY_DN54747_c0_g2_i1:94-1779(-)
MDKDSTKDSEGSSSRDSLSEGEACERKMEELELQLEAEREQRRTLQVQLGTVATINRDKEDQIYHMQGLIHQAQFDGQKETQELQTQLATLTVDKKKTETELLTIKHHLQREQQLNISLTRRLEEKEHELALCLGQLEEARIQLRDQARILDSRPADPITREIMEDRVQALQLAWEATLDQKDSELKEAQQQIEGLEKQLASVPQASDATTNNKGEIPSTPTAKGTPGKPEKDTTITGVPEFESETVDIDIASLQKLLDNYVASKKGASAVQSMEQIYSKKEALQRALEAERKNRESERRRHQEMQTLLSKLFSDNTSLHQNTSGGSFHWPDNAIELAAHLMPTTNSSIHSTPASTPAPPPLIGIPEAQLGQQTGCIRATPHRPKRPQPATNPIHGASATGGGLGLVADSPNIPRLQSSQSTTALSSMDSNSVYSSGRKSPGAAALDFDSTHPAYFVMSGGQPSSQQKHSHPQASYPHHLNAGNSNISSLLSNALLNSPTPAHSHYLSSPQHTATSLASRLSPAKDSPLSVAAYHCHALSPRPTPLRLALEYRRESAGAVN